MKKVINVLLHRSSTHLDNRIVHVKLNHLISRMSIVTASMTPAQPTLALCPPLRMAEGVRRLRNPNIRTAIATSCANVGFAMHTGRERVWGYT
jgi:hypothetical protein